MPHSPAQRKRGFLNSFKYWFDDLSVALGLGVVVVRDVLSVGIHPEDQPTTLLWRKLHAVVSRVEHLPERRADCEVLPGRGIGGFEKLPIHTAPVLDDLADEVVRAVNEVVPACGESPLVLAPVAGAQVGRLGCALLAVAGDALCVEDRLHETPVVERRGAVRTWLDRAWRATHRDRRVLERRAAHVLLRFVASAAHEPLAGVQVRVAAHVLHGAAVGAERLEEERHANGCEEVRAAIRLHRQPAPCRGTGVPSGDSPRRATDAAERASS